MANVNKRRWRAPDGTMKEAWTCRYFDQKGVRRSATFALKKDADAHKRKMERQLEDGVHVADADAMTIPAIAEAFLAHSEERMRTGAIGKSRYVRFEHVNRKFVKPFFGSQRFRDVTLVQVEQFYSEMTGKHGLKPITARENVVVLRMMERFARRRGYMTSQPVTDALSEIRGAPREKVKTFTAEDMATLLHHADTRPAGAKPRPHAMMRCMVNVAAFCGLRMGEILGLTLKHIDFEAGVIRVRHSLTQYGVLKGPKTKAGIRDVPVPQHVLAMLREWIATHYVEQDDGLVFRTASGGAIQAQNYRVTWMALLKRAGLLVDGDLPHHFHALRHFTASWMQHNGLPMADIARLLGHSSFDVTLQIYVHSVVAPHMQHSIVERMVAQMPPALTHERHIAA